MMVICTNGKTYDMFEISHFDAFRRTITFTNLPFNKGRVRPK